MDLSEQTKNVFRSTDEVFKRLFNHRPFLNAQLQIMVENFDDEQSKDLLNEINSKKSMTNELIDKLMENKLINDNGEKLLNKLNKIENQMQQLIDSESINEIKRKESNEKYSNEKLTEFNKFINDINLQMINIDNSYINTKNEIDLKYKKLLNN